MNVTYNSALKMVSVSTNTILSTTAGFFVLLIGFVVFCIPIRKIHLLCVIVAIIGSFLVCVLGSADNDNDPEQPRTLFDHIVGHGLSILSAFLYGLYSVVIEYFTDKEKPLDEQKDSITAQRKEAENEEKEEERVAQMEAVHLYGFVHNSSTDLTRSHSINNGLLGSSPSDLTNVSVKIENHMTQTSADICDDHHNNFGFGVCNEQAGISTYDVTLDDSDDEEDAIPEVLPANYDPNNPKLITGLLFGCVGLINLVFAWPFIGLFHFSGFETLSLPDSRAIPMLVMNSFLGAAASDFLWANSVILTSPIIATLTIPGTIPIAMCYETFFLHKPLSLYSVLGSILIVASSSVVTIMQYFEDKKYDKMTKKMLDKRDEKKAKEKLQRQKYRERQRQLRQLEAINTIVDKNGDDTDENGNADDGVTQRNVHNNQQTNPQITPNSHHYSTPRPTIVAQ
jgi:drug/metabolite transporter (DMT)-like permease